MALTNGPDEIQRSRSGSGIVSVLSSSSPNRCKIIGLFVRPSIRVFYEVNNPYLFRRFKVDARQFETENKESWVSNSRHEPWKRDAQQARIRI